MKTIAVSFLCLLLTGPSVLARQKDGRSVGVPHKVSTATDDDAWRESTGDARIRRAAALDTTFLLDHRFDNGQVVCDSMGWTANDNTQQLADYWHVDDFAGLASIHGGLVPLQGSRSMWCGARPDNADLVKCSYVDLPGYANNWNQWLQTEQCLTVTGDVELSFQIFWDSEPLYDFTYIQWDECDDNWQDLVDGGLDGLGQWDTTLVVPASLHSGHIRFRFLFQSDGAWSDADGKYNTDGACTIDMLQVDDAGGNVLALEDFEDEAVGDTGGDGWVSELAQGYGELAALFQATKVVQEDPCHRNLTCIWGFFSGSTADYGCGTPPHPEQLAVPYVNARGQYVDQQIWSPWIELGGSGSVIELDFNTYWDLSIVNLVFSDWRVRGIDSTAANPCPSRWFDDGLLDFGDDKTWRRTPVEIGALIPAGSTHIQVSLDVYDRCVLGDYGCSLACHSHAPLYDDVTVYRVGAVGPQWKVQDIHQFQDTFPDDGTITGTARADMAMDNNWDDFQETIVPGDSAVVHVGDPTTGLAVEGNGRAAVFCYVSIDGPHAGTAAPGLICDSRYAYVTDETRGGRTWHKFQTDSCYTVGGAAVPDDYNFDFCDNLLVPGDKIWFFWGARNTDGVYTYASAALATVGHQSTSGDEAAIHADEFQILPAAGRDVSDGGLGGDILYVDGMNFLGAQPFFDTAFMSFGELHKIDRYDIRGPSSHVGNHPASRVTDVSNQLTAIYTTIIWNTGDLDGVFSDGTSGLDKSDDTGMCLAFIDNLVTGDRGGIYLDGDNVASEWLEMDATSAISLRNLYMNFDVTATNHQPVVGYNPWGIPTPGGIFEHPWADDTLVVQGGCPTPYAFDVLQPNGPNTRTEMDYHDWRPDSTFAPAILSQMTQNSAGDFVGFILSGFSFHHIRNFELGGVLVRYQHMHSILLYLKGLVDFVEDAGTPVVARNHLEQNVPNPFNPTTTIRYEVRESGPVTLKIYNVAGQLVRTLVDGERAAGQVHEATWNGLNDGGRPVSSGVYFYKLVARDFTQTKKMVLLK
jgi:hypothetical protein